VSSIKNANKAQKRLTHSFPRNRITSPITFTFPIRNMLFIIRPVAIEEAWQKLFPVIAICKTKPTTSYEQRKMEKTQKTCPDTSSCVNNIFHV
jgi:hypothetical protein